MNPRDLVLAKALAKGYGRTSSVAYWHRCVYSHVRNLHPHTAPEVWLSTVMQLAKA